MSAFLVRFCGRRSCERAAVFLAWFIRLVLAGGFVASAPVLTSQYDNARTGATLQEAALTPANVNVGQFGKLFSLRVDGDVYAQPLYVPHWEIPGKGIHNVLFVATEHNSVYAFDADHGPLPPLWQVSFLNTKAGVTTVSEREASCPFITPEIGITPTPVLDEKTGTLYVLARTREAQGFFSPNRYVQRLHALAITTGAEKFGGPIEIKASVSSSHRHGASRKIPFDPLRELPRAALLLASGHVYLTWGSSCDVGPYHGWVMAYDAQTLAQTAVFNTSPDSQESGIWQSDMGPAADVGGDVYLATGNGLFDAARKGRNFGDSLLRLTRHEHRLTVRDFFTPFNEEQLNAGDADLGSGGPLLLPDQPGPHPHLLLVGGKEGVLYVLDRDHLGAFQPDGDSILQAFRLGGGLYAAPAYWNRPVYVLASNDSLRAFTVGHGPLSEQPAALGKQRFGNPGATPALSAHGIRNGIVWIIETKSWNGADRPAVLHAYDAGNGAREIYHSEQNSRRDRAGLTLRFTVPTIANGRVYVEAKGEVDVYGLLTGR